MVETSDEEYQRLQTRLEELESAVAERKRAEEALRERTHRLGERVKELNCLYGISALVEKPTISLAEILQGTVELMPPAWQYPEITGARVILEGQEFRTKNFRETTTWQQAADIIVYGQRSGIVEVCYLEERPESNEGPFLEEERSLLNAIAERLGRIAERVQAQEALRKSHDELETRVEERTAELAKANEELRNQITERKQAEEALEAARVLQQSLIDEERERIARELHDGLAQILGYVNTKAMAVRLMLKNQQVEAADQHLLQLEEAARELFVDVRRVILDLKMTGQGGAGLAVTLKEFTAQFSRLSGLPVELALAPAVESLALTTEIELQLLRIVQESLSNVRKHASATNAWISLRINDGVLELTISDDGKGFDPDRVRTTHWPHFGLSTMPERAETIGAEFDLDSAPGAGTRVTVRLSVASRQ